MKAFGVTVVALLFGIPLLVVVLLAGGNCAPAGSVATAVNTAAVQTEPVAGYGHEQLVNAALIMNAANTAGLDSRAQIIGVMTAMGESSLNNINYGDNAINPDGTVADSIGLFQQQTWWGTVAERMDPTTAAAKFFTKLKAVAGWADLQPTIAAHRVQGNADPNFYTKFYDPAVAVVGALTGVTLDTTKSAGSACNVGPTGNYAANGTAPGPWGGYSNGGIPLDQLAPIPWSDLGAMYLRSDAVAALTQMNNAFRAQFGYNLPMNDGYRSFAEQVDAKIIYGDEAATPGYSNHGWALAVDIGDKSHRRLGYDSAIYAWLKAHAGAYGWVHPAWAEPDGSGPHEAWHWEYYGLRK